MSTISQAVARPVRTGAQLSVAEVSIQVVEAFFYDLNEAQHIALLGALTIIYGVLQVLIENKAGKAVLRYIPPTEAPLTDSALTEEPVQTDNRPRPEDGGQLPPEESGLVNEWHGKEMR